jgi:uncharacterized protein involved in exopolysaccharide biosynthesis
MTENGAILTLGDLARVVLGGWRTIAVCVVVVAASAVALALLMKPVYRGETLLAPAASDTNPGSTLQRLAGQLGPLTDLVGGGDAGSGLDSKDLRLATLRSRRLTEQFIRDRNLFPKLFPDRWDGGTQAWKKKNGKPDAPTIDEAFRFFDDKIRRVSEERRTGLVTLSIDWRDPREAADWANDLVFRANEFLRSRAKEEASRSITFLEGELEKTSVVERRQIIYRLIESRTSQIMMANGRREYAYIVIDPAVAADADHYIRPRRPMIISAGLALGGVIGVVVTLIRYNLRTGARRIEPMTQPAAARSLD